MELSGLNPLGLAAASAVTMPLRKAPDVQKVDPGQQSNGAGTDARQRPEQDATASQARDITEIRRQMERRDLPAGPPPTFELSLLEVESDLKQVLARIEAQRAQSRDSEAVQTDSAPQSVADKAQASAVSDAQSSVATAEASLSNAESTAVEA